MSEALFNYIAVIHFLATFFAVFGTAVVTVEAVCPYTRTCAAVVGAVVSWVALILLLVGGAFLYANAPS